MIAPPVEAGCEKRKQGGPGKRRLAATCQTLTVSRHGFDSLICFEITLNGERLCQLEHTCQAKARPKD